MTIRAEPTFAYLLGALARSDFSGTVSLREGSVERKVLLQEGRLVDVASSSQAETLGRVLLDEGRITAEEYARLLDKMAATRRSAGELLVQMGLVRADEAVAALGFQVRRKLLNCFRPNRVELALLPGPVAPERVLVRLEPASVLFDGLRQVLGPKRVEREFPLEEDTVFRGCALPGAAKLRLDLLPAQVWESIGERATLAEIKQAMGRLENLQAVLYGLHALGLVDVAGRDRPRFAHLRTTTPVPRERAGPHEAGPVIARRSTDGDALTRTAPGGTAEVTAGLAEKVLCMAGDDHFAVLGVGHDASDDQVRDAFYQLVDNYKLQDPAAAYPGERDRELARHLLDRLSRAYQQLADQKRRNDYLRALERDRARRQAVDPRVLADTAALKGELALGAGRFDEARRHFEQAIDAYPMEPGYHHKLGLAGYLEALRTTPQGRPLPAGVRAPFEEALALDPAYDPACFYLGIIARRNGDLDEARRALEGALQINPDNQQARRALDDLDEA